MKLGNINMIESKEREAALEYLHWAKKASLWRRYFHALISVTAWDSRREVEIHSRIKNGLPLPRAVRFRLKNRRTFFNGLEMASKQWKIIKQLVSEGDRDRLVKMKIGLGYKGISVLFRDSGFKNYIPLDTNILQVEFGLTPKEGARVQSNEKLYKQYEKQFIERYGEDAPVKDLEILAKVIGYQRIRDFTKVAWK